MLEPLFTQSSAIARYRSAPLLKERLHYLAHCAQIGIKPETLRKIAFSQLNLACVLDLQDGDDDLRSNFVDSSGLPNSRAGASRVWRTGSCRRGAIPAKRFRKD